MLIESKIKRPTAPIDMGDGTVYFFAPKDGNPNSPHVCEVSTEHARKLLAIPEGYTLPLEAAPPAPLTRAAPVAPQGDTKVPEGDAQAGDQTPPTGDSAGDNEPPAGDDTPPVDSLTDEQRSRIDALLALSVPDLRAGLPGIDDTALLAAALATERQKKNRTTVITALSGRLSALGAPAV